MRVVERLDVIEDVSPYGGDSVMAAGQPSGTTAGTALSCGTAQEPKLTPIATDTRLSLICH
jgi:hypothetical protein